MKIRGFYRGVTRAEVRRLMPLVIYRREKTGLNGAYSPHPVPPKVNFPPRFYFGIESYNVANISVAFSLFGNCILPNQKLAILFTIGLENQCFRFCRPHTIASHSFFTIILKTEKPYFSLGCPKIE